MRHALLDINDMNGPPASGVAGCFSRIMRQKPFADVFAYPCVKRVVRAP